MCGGLFPWGRYIVDSLLKPEKSVCVTSMPAAAARTCVFCLCATAVGVISSTEGRDGKNRHHLHQREREQDQRAGALVFLHMRGP